MDNDVLLKDIFLLLCGNSLVLLGYVLGATAIVYVGFIIVFIMVFIGMYHLVSDKNGKIKKQDDQET